MDLALTPAQRTELSSDRIVVGVRPEGFMIGTAGGLDATVDLVEELGSECYLYCTAPGVADRSVVVRTEGLSSSRSGDTVSLVPRSGALHLFDAGSGKRLPES